MPDITTLQGARVENADNSLRAGPSGPALLQDFYHVEKQQHFNRERVPERVVHARGFGVKGFFECTESLSAVTTAAPFQTRGSRTPVFVRYSTVSGSRGAPDTVRDVRGFAIKFYTEAGNWDLVANNIPIFFIQDAVHFPDLIHALKPEPQHDVPQSSTRHLAFWKFMAQRPESTAMQLWIMSDRTLPRSYATMAGFGVHTFLFETAAGEYSFVKFHLLPRCGCHSMLEREAEVIRGADPDFHRRDLITRLKQVEAVGDAPKCSGGEDPQELATWDFAVQVFSAAEAAKFPYSVLDATKIIPSYDVPLKVVGRLTLTETTTDFFAETEQVAFCPGNLIPGIRPSFDPLLQGRLFAYKDAALYRAGTNHQQLGVNRPRCPMSHIHRDGLMQTQVFGPDQSNVTPPVRHGAVSVPGPKIEAGHPTYQRPPQFADHHSQAALFWHSMTASEQTRIVDAFAVQLNSILADAECRATAEQVAKAIIRNLALVDSTLASQVRSLVDPTWSDPLPAPLHPTVKPDPTLSLFHAQRGLTGARTAVFVVSSVSASTVTTVKQFLTLQHFVPYTVGLTREPAGAIDIVENTSCPSLFDGLVVLTPDAASLDTGAPQIPQWINTFVNEMKPVLVVYTEDMSSTTRLTQQLQPADGVWHLAGVSEAEMLPLVEPMKRRYFNRTPLATTKFKAETTARKRSRGE